MSVADLHEETKCPRCGYTGIYDLICEGALAFIIFSDWDGNLLDGFYCIGPDYLYNVPHNLYEYKHKYYCHKCSYEYTKEARYTLDWLSKGYPLGRGMFKYLLR